VKVIIVGAGGHAQVIADALICRARLGEKLELIGFLDDDLSLKGKVFLGAPVLGRIDELDACKHDALVVGIGNNRTRMSVYNRLQSKGARFLSVIHPSAVIASDAAIGQGTVVFGGTVINTGSVIGPNVIVNTGATIDHHAHIAAHAHIAPGVHLGGTVTVGEGAFFGIGSNVLPNLTIGNWSTIGAGAVVVNDIPSNVTVVGVPAKVIKRNPNS
jgi:sugar O-acyltransferase (sialic acid O-acetyltransferase NeuD family)